MTTYKSESAWSDGGGGVSGYEGEPSYQNGFQSDKARTVPDVSYDANPSTGFAVYDSTNYEGYVGWYEVGGTSAGAPQWSAIVALADQVRGGGSTNALNTGRVENTLYGLASNATTYAADLHDVTSGSNGYAATKGYDLATGLGTPQVTRARPGPGRRHGLVYLHPGFGPQPRRRRRPPWTPHRNRSHDVRDRIRGACRGHGRLRLGD